jgi:hypothetical protein
MRAEQPNIVLCFWDKRDGVLKDLTTTSCTSRSARQCRRSALGRLTARPQALAAP